jgi:hypothetical protein
MATIRQWIEVEASFDAAHDTWGRFVEWVLVGPSRLACNEIACVSAADTGVVTFEPLAEGHTRVVFDIAVDDAAVEELVRDNARHDLRLFKQYVESGDHARAHPPKAEVADGLKQQRRKRADAPPPGYGDAAARRQLPGFGDS